MLSLVLAIGFATWQGTEATRQRDAYLTGLEHWVKAEAYGLHHWLHTAQKEAGFVRPSSGDTRALEKAEIAALKSHYRAPWLNVPNGWTLTRLISTPAHQVNNPKGEGEGQRAHGILVLQTDAHTRGWEKRLITPLCQRLAEMVTLSEAEHLAKTALVSLDFGNAGCDLEKQNTALAIFAAPFAGITPELVLREPRSGYPASVMAANIALTGNDIGQCSQTPQHGCKIEGVARIEAQTLDGLRRLSPRDGPTITLSGALRRETPKGGDPARSLTVDQGLEAPWIDLKETLNVRGGIRAKHIAVTQGLAVDNLLEIEDTLKTGGCAGC